MTDSAELKDFSVKLGIFAKPPRNHQVKTRLIPDIGAAQATEVYRQCLSHALAISNDSNLPHCCYLTEACADPVFTGLEQHLQTGHNLGDRMFNAFQEMLCMQNTAIIIGTDCLDMSSQHLQQAASLLQQFDIVIQPVLDGGYSLIGCRRINPALFHDVHWSTGQVLTQTVANAERLGYSVARLETVRDIDTLEDLKHYPQFKHLLPGQLARN